MNVFSRIDHYSDYNEVYPAALFSDPQRKAKPYCEHCLGGDHRITYFISDGVGGYNQIADACLGIWLESDEEADRVRQHYLPKPGHQNIRLYLTPEQESWARDTDSPALTPDHRTTLAVGFVPPRFAESFKNLVGSYDRWVAAELAKGPPSEYVGEEHHRLDLDVVCGKVFGPYHTDYGESCRYTFTTGPNGRDCLSWFTKAGVTWFEPNKAIKIRATIKEHKLWMGLRRTDLSRVALAKVVSS